MWKSIVLHGIANLEQGIAPAVLINKLYVLLGCIVLFILSRLTIRFLKKGIERLLEHRAIRLDERRRRTMAGLATNVLRYVVYFFFVLALFELFNFPVRTLLTGAGVAGLVVGLGAQNLIRDVISGFFIIFEDQFAVGDLITTGVYSGTVIEIGLRITKLAAATGEVHILPNGQITQVTNHSQGPSTATIDLHFKYETNIDDLLDTLHTIVQHAEAEIDGIYTTPTIQGIEDFGASDMTIRITVECSPMVKAKVARELRLRLKRGLSEANITMP